VRRDDLRLLKVPAFRRLWLARTISLLGSAVTPVALAFGVLDLPGAGPKDLALVLTAQTAATLATVLLGGVLGDRLPRTRMLMAAESIAGVAVGTMAVLFLTGRATPAMLALLGALAGAASGLLVPVLGGLVPETVAEDRLQPANALLSFSRATVQIGGAALGGLLVATVGPGWALALDGASFIIGVVIVARIPAVRRDREPSSMLHDLRDGWRGFLSFRWIWGSTLAATVWLGAWLAAFQVLGPVVAKASLGGATAWAAVLAGLPIGSVLGTFVATRIRPKRPMVVVLLMMEPSALLVALLAIPASVPILVASTVLIGISYSVLGVLWSTLLQVHVPRDLLARVTAIDYLGSAAAIPLGTAVVGSLAAAFGVRATLLGAAGVIVLSGLGGLVVRDVWTVGLEKPEIAEAVATS
jgi:MFS family permease